MAFKIPVRYDAFRVKRPRIHKPEYLPWIRQLPCLVTGRTDAIEAAHIRFADTSVGKRTVGMGEKPDDRWTVPLTADEHRKQHSGSEMNYWHHVGIDPLIVALALYGCFPDAAEAESIISIHQRRARA
jgi:hypothetical protein